MVSQNQVFVAWEERIISHEKGNRVVHFYLKESCENSILAVVGTERSIRHMIYIVSQDFADAYGYMGIVTAGTKWRARREVVEWLTELVAEIRQPAAISSMLCSCTIIKECLCCDSDKHTLLSVCVVIVIQMSRIAIF